MKTVVLIDDDRLLRQILARSLEEGGWRVYEADDGEAGLTLVREHRPQLVLCDLLMPRCNGFQVCRAIRSDGQLSATTRIIVTTGSDFISDHTMARDAGADGVLVKPVRSSALNEMVSQLLPPPSAAPPKADGASASRQHHQSARVKFWGVRGSIPTPGPTTVRYGGNTSCVELRADGEIIIFDAGTGIRPLGLQLASEFKNQALNIHLLLTHTHWDHIQGWPFFVPAYNPKHKVKILGYEGARRGLESTLSSQMESPYFPIGMHQMPANISITELKEMRFPIGNLEIRAEFTNHPGVCVGYRVGTTGGSFAYMPDNEPFVRVDTRPDAELSPDERARMEFAMARDARLIEFLRDTDVLIIDSQYDAEEYKTHVGWGHGCIDAVVKLAAKANVKHLFLFHHDPNHDDARIDQFVVKAREVAKEIGSPILVEAAMEGYELILEPKKP